MSSDRPSPHSTSRFRSTIRSDDTLDGDLTSPLIRPATVNDDFNTHTDTTWKTRLADRLRRGRARLWGSGKSGDSGISTADSVERTSSYGNIQYSEVSSTRNSSAAYVHESMYNSSNTPVRSSMGGGGGLADDSIADNNLVEFSSSDFRYSRRQSLAVRFKISKLTLDYWLRKQFSRFRDWPLVLQIIFLVPLPLYVGLLLFIFAVTNRHRPYLFFNRCDWVAIAVAGALFQLGFFAAAIDLFPFARHVYVTKLNDLVDYYGVFFSYIFASIFYSMIVIIYILKDQSFLQQRKRQRRLRTCSSTSDSLSSANDMQSGTSTTDGSQRTVAGSAGASSQPPCSRRSAIAAMVIGTPNRSSGQRTVTGAAAAAAALTADPPSFSSFANDLSNSLNRHGVSPLTSGPQVNPNQQESCITPEIAAAAAQMMIQSSSFNISSSSAVSSSDQRSTRYAATSPKHSLSPSQRSRNPYSSAMSTTASQFSSSTGYRNQKPSASYFAPLTASTLHLPPPVNVPEREVGSVVRRSLIGIGSRDNSSASNIDEKQSRNHFSPTAQSMQGGVYPSTGHRGSDRSVKVPSSTSRTHLSSSGVVSGVEVEVSEDTECGADTMRRSSGNDVHQYPQTFPVSGPHSVSNSTESSLSRPLFTHADAGGGSPGSTNPNTEERFSMSYFVTLNSNSETHLGATRNNEDAGSRSENNTIQQKRSNRTPPSPQTNDWSALGIGDSQHHMADSISHKTSKDEQESQQQQEEKEQETRTRFPNEAIATPVAFVPLNVSVSDEGAEDVDSDTVSNSHSTRGYDGPHSLARGASDIETQPPSAAASLTAYRGGVRKDSKGMEVEGDRNSARKETVQDHNATPAKQATQPTQQPAVSERETTAGRDSNLPASSWTPSHVLQRGATLTPQNTANSFQDRMDSRSSTDPHFIFETRASMKEKHLSPTAHAANRGHSNRANGGLKTRNSRDDMYRSGDQRATTASANSSGGHSRGSDRMDHESLSPTQLSPTLSGFSELTPRTQQRQVRKSYRRQRGGHGPDSPKQKARSSSGRSNDGSGSQRASRHGDNDEDEGNSCQREEIAGAAAAAGGEEQGIAETENKLLQRIRQQNMVNCITQSIFQDIVQEEQVCDVKADMIHLRLINHVEQRGARIMFITAPISLITVFVMRLRTMSTCPCESVSLMWDPEYIVEPLFWIHTIYWVQLIFGVLTLNFLALLIFYQQVQLVYYSTNLKKWYEEELKGRTQERRKQRAKEGYTSPLSPSHGPAAAATSAYPGSPALGPASGMPSSPYGPRPAYVSTGLSPAFTSPTGATPTNVASPPYGAQNASVAGVPTYSNYAVFNPYPNDPGYVGYFQLANHMHIQQTAVMLAQTELPQPGGSLSSSMIQAFGGGGSVFDSGRGGGGVGANGEGNPSFVKASPESDSSRKWGFLSSLGRMNSITGSSRSPTGTTPVMRPSEFTLPPVMAGKLSDSTRILTGRLSTSGASYSCGANSSNNSSSNNNNSNGIDHDEDVMGLVAFGWHDLSVPENMLVYFKVYNGIMEQISQTPGTAALCISSFITCIANFVTISILLSSLILSSLNFNFLLVLRGTVPFILVLAANTIAIGLFVYLLVGLTAAVEMQIKRITVVQSNLQKQIDRQHFAQYNKLVAGSNEELARRRKERRQRKQKEKEREKRRRHRHRRHRRRNEPRHQVSGGGNSNSPQDGRVSPQPQHHQEDTRNSSSSRSIDSSSARRGQRQFPTAPPHSDFASAETLPGLLYGGTGSTRVSISNNADQSLGRSGSSPQQRQLQQQQPNSSTSSTYSRSPSSYSSSSEYSGSSRSCSSSSCSSSTFSSSGSSSSRSYSSSSSSSSKNDNENGAVRTTRRKKHHSRRHRRRHNQKSSKYHRHHRNNNRSRMHRRAADANQVLLDVSAASSSSSPAALRAKVNALKALSTYVRQSDVQPNLLGVSLDSMRWWVVIIFLTTLNAVFALLLLDVCFDANGLIPDGSNSGAL